MKRRKRLITPTSLSAGALVVTLLVLGDTGLDGFIAIGVLAVIYFLLRRGVLRLDRRLAIALVGTAAMLALSGYGLLTLVLVPAMVYLLWQVSTTPLSHAIARSKASLVREPAARRGGRQPRGASPR